MTIESTHPSFTQCPDCKRYYEGRGVPICQDTAGLTERIVCVSCAKLMDWQGCYICGELDAHDCADQWLCSDCAETEGWAICSSCSKGYGEDELANCHGDILCESCRDEAGWQQCEGCEGWFHRDDLQSGPHGNDYCSDCWCDRFFCCDGCGEVFYNDDMYSTDNGCYCSGCTPNQEDFEPIRFRGRAEYTVMPSKRKFGVELETDSCDNYEELSGGYWGAKYDGSINGKEFYSGILYGDEGLEACKDICKFAKHNGWEVDGSCGYHAHFDMTGETEDSLKAMACAYMLTYEVWNQFVDPDRIDNCYCRSHSASISDLYSSRSFSSFVSNQGRHWVNFSAYNKHRTFEVRLHEGTLDGEEVCNWIKAHATFMDWASKVGWNTVRNSLLCLNNADKFEFIAQIWARAGCAELGEYYGSKIGIRQEVYA